MADQDDLEEIYCNAYAYLHGASLGGINSALLRPLGCGVGALALDTVYNREVLEMSDGRVCGMFWQRFTPPQPLPIWTCRASGCIRSKAR